MNIIEILKAVLLGVVQGITEWLPISSTGHMILVEEFIQLQASPAFKEMFFVVIQLASILAVILIFFHKLNPFSPKKSAHEKKETWDIWFKVVLAVIPAGVIGVLFEDQIDAIFFNWQTVSIALIVYGILFIVIERWNEHKQPKINNFKQLDYKTAFMIGLFQVLALIPGTSRSGATIIGAILIGTSRAVAAEFSFFLSIPVMVGASALKLMKFGFHFTPLELSILLTGMIVSFVVSVVAIKFFMSYIKKKDFKVFGWYRIVLGALVILYFSFLHN